MSRLVLIPGLLCNADLFAPQIQALAGEIDIIIADTTGMDSIEQMASKILDDVSGDMIVVGHSMGGYIAMEVARCAPERIIGLGLLSTSAGLDSAARTKSRKDMSRPSSIGTFKGVTPHLLPKLVAPHALKNKKITDKIMEMAADIGQENFILQQTAIMSRRDQRRNLRAYHRPSLVLCGLLDKVTPPKLSEEIDECLADSELVLLTGTAHLPTLEAPCKSSHAIRELIRRADGQ